MVQETTSVPGDRNGSANPTRSKAKKGTIRKVSVRAHVRGLLARVRG